MTPKTWKDLVRQTKLLRADERRVVFYPLGPFRGYVLFRMELEPIVVGSLARCYAINFAILIVAFAVGVMFGNVMTLLTVVGFIDFFHYYIRVRRLTRKLPLMPHDLSVRFYASKQDREKLSQQFVSQLVMAFMMLAFLVLLPVNPMDRLTGFVGVLMLAGLSGVTGYILHVKRRLNVEGSA